MAALSVDAFDGYSTEGDFTDDSPVYGEMASGATLMEYGSQISFLWGGPHSLWVEAHELVTPSDGTGGGSAESWGVLS